MGGTGGSNRLGKGREIGVSGCVWAPYGRGPRGRDRWVGYAGRRWARGPADDAGRGPLCRRMEFPTIDLARIYGARRRETWRPAHVRVEAAMTPPVPR